MGSIRRFNIAELQALNGAKCFFETGTWKGDGLAYACRYSFTKLYSSEIVESLAEKAAERFASDPRVKIIADSSESALVNYVDQENSSFIFWLDAHFPGAEEGLSGYNEYSDELTKLPLQRELEIIAAKRTGGQDIILIDDLRIYEEGPFQNGNLPDKVIPPKNRNIDFAFNLFGQSHAIIRSFKDEGYLILLPLNRKPLTLLQRAWYGLGSALKGKIRYER